MPDAPNSATRWSLLGRLRDWGDEKSWLEFFNTYWRLIYAVAVRAGLNDSEAQEVVQETVIAVAKKMPTFECDPARGSFKGWLLQITWRRIADQLRKRHRDRRHVSHPTTDQLDDDTQTNALDRLPDPAGFDLEKLWNDEWDKHLFEAALEKVKQHADAEDYQIFDLHMLKGFPVAEVARTLGIKSARVYVVKYKISALLKQAMKELKRAT